MNIQEVFPELVYLLPSAVFLCAFISGTLGLAGGSLLILILASQLSVPLAFMLHGAAQASSNIVRSVLYYQHTPWRSVARFYLGLCISVGLLSFLSWLPEKRTLFLLVALISCIALIIPKSIAPDFKSPWVAFISGVLVGVPTLVAGVSGGVLDMFFLKSKLNRYEVMASKSLGMFVLHVVKIVYAYSFLVLPLSDVLSLLSLLPSVFLASLSGTLLGKSALARLNEEQFRVASCTVFAIVTLLSLYRSL